MKEHHDVHVFQNALHGGWKCTQGKRVLVNHRPWEAAMAYGVTRAKRDQVDLVMHGGNERVRLKDCCGNESTTSDTEH